MVVTRDVATLPREALGDGLPGEALGDALAGEVWSGAGRRGIPGTERR